MLPEVSWSLGQEIANTFLLVTKLTQVRFRVNGKGDES